MTPRTAKAIKDVIGCMDSCFGPFYSGSAESMRASREQLERALHDLVESIKLEAIEP